MDSCCICFENSNEVISCFNCKTSTCIECLKEYKSVLCPGCNELFSDCSLKKILQEKLIKEEFIQKYYVNDYVYKKFKKLENTTLNKYFIALENKKQLRYGTIFSRGKNTFINNKDCIKRCLINKCNGFVNKEFNCMFCETKYCNECEEIKKRNHICDENILENLKGLRSDPNCKTCIYCFAFILKTVGCDDMVCTNCGAKFNWVSLEIQKNTSNYHYTNIVDAELNKKRKNYEKTNNTDIINLTDILNDFELEDSLDNNLPNLYKHDLNFAKMLNNVKINIIKSLKRVMKNQNKIELEYSHFLTLALDEKKNKAFLRRLFKCYKEKEYFEKINLYLNHNKRIILTLDSISEFLENIDKAFIFPKDIIYKIVDGNFIKEKQKENVITQFSNKSIVKNCLLSDFLESDFLDSEYEKNVKKNVKKNVTKNTNFGKKIKLLDQNQVIHQEKILDMLKKNKIVLNSSSAGSGKTYVSLYNANELKMKKLFIICPPIMKQKWFNVIEEYNTAYNFEFKIVSYSDLTLNVNKMENDFIYKKIKYSMNYTSFTYHLNEKMQNYFDSETMLIVDEGHIGRNKSIISDIICLFASTIRSAQGYYLFLSATPYEKKEQIKTLIFKLGLMYSSPSIEEMFKFDGIWTTDELKNIVSYHKNLIRIISEENLVDTLINSLLDPNFETKTITMVNIGEKVIQHLINAKVFNELFINKEGIYQFLTPDTDGTSDFNLKTNEFVHNCSNIFFIRKVANLIRYCLSLNLNPLLSIFLSFHMFCFPLGNTNLVISNLEKIILQKYIFCMKSEIEVDCSLGEYFLTNEEQLKIDFAFTNIDVKTQTAFKCLSIFSKGLMQTETVYINVVAKLLETIIPLCPKTKFVVGFNYLCTNEDLYNLMKSKVNTRTITGKDNEKRKNEIISLFQKDTDECRLLIINQQALNMGVDLDDKTGEYNRFVIISPGFSTTVIYQFMHRFKRLDSKTQPVIHILNTHSRITDILKRKGQNLEIFKLNMIPLETFPIWLEVDDEILNLVNKLNNRNEENDKFIKIETNENNTIELNDWSFTSVKDIVLTRRK